MTNMIVCQFLDACLCVNFHRYTLLPLYVEKKASLGRDFGFSAYSGILSGFTEIPRQSLTVHPCPGSSAAHWTWDSLLDQRSLGLHLKSTDKTCFISRSQAVLGSTARNVGITDKFHIVRLFYEQEQDSVQHCINV